MASSASATFLLADLVRHHAAPLSQSELSPVLPELTALAEPLLAQHSGNLIRFSDIPLAAMFDTANDAITAALAIWDAWRQTTKADRFTLRFALHSGTAGTLVGRYFGTVLNRAQQLLNMTLPGQIIISTQTHDAIEGQLPHHAVLQECGQGRLKDLLPAEPFFQLRAPTLSTASPPLRFIETYPTNLPTQPTPFLGRAREIAATQALLDRPDIQLVTLVAPSGLGKTRFALEVGTRMLEQFSHGVYFIALAPISDPSLVLPTIAHTLGLKDSGDQPVVEQLQRYLHNRKVLLVLDNIEQVASAATDLTTLLVGTPALKLLATSHIPLQISGEQIVTVPPLELPGQSDLPLDQLIDYAAIGLFVERMQAVAPEQPFDESSAAAITHICEIVAGAPLAIELVAAYGDTFTLPEILQQLTSIQDPTARPLTLQQVLDWSYGNLDPATQTIFARLGVFVGGCTIKAAEAVCSFKDQDSIDVLNEIGVLLRRNLLLSEELDDGEPRYIMLDCIRDDAWARLTERVEQERVQAQLNQHYSAILVIIWQESKGPLQQAWLRWLHGEQHNVRAALHWAHQHNDAMAMANLCRGSLMYWYQYGYYHEGIAWHKAALSFGRQLPAREHAGLHNDVTLLYGTLGDYENAYKHSIQALALYRSIDAHLHIAIVLHNLGYYLRLQGRYHEAKAYLQESLLMFRTYKLTGDTPALTYTHLGYIIMEEGDYPTAQVHFDQALRLARKQGAQRIIVNALLHRGLFNLVQSKYDAALLNFHEGLQLSRALGGHDKLAALLDGVAGVASARRKAAYAARLMGAAEARREHSGQLAPVFLEGARYQQLLQDVQSQLTPEDFNTAWTEGRALTHEQAIALGLDFING